MAVDAVLLESPTMRATVADRVEVLDRVRALQLLPDGVHLTTEGVAAYFGVGLKAVYSLVTDHRAELALNGCTVLTGERLTSFKTASGIRSRAHSPLFTRRTVLNVAMLLRDSEAARQVRCHLLDVEQGARRSAVDGTAQPVDNAPPPPAAEGGRRGCGRGGAGRSADLTIGRTVPGTVPIRPGHRRPREVRTSSGPRWSPGS